MNTYFAYLPVLTGSGFLRRSLYTMYVHKLRTNANPNIAPANISRFLLSFLPKIIETSCAIYCWCVCVLLKVHTYYSDNYNSYNFRHLTSILNTVRGSCLLTQIHIPPLVYSQLRTVWKQNDERLIFCLHACIYMTGLCHSVVLPELTVNISLTECKSNCNSMYIRYTIDSALPRSY